MIAKAAKVVPLLCVLLLTLLGGCTMVITPEVITPEPVEELPQVNPNGIIFTAEQSAAIPDLLTNVLSPTPENTWTPAITDVAQLEADLPTFLQSAEDPWLRPDPPIWERVPDYYRQYFGIVENGEEIIYANFFCDNDQPNWRSDYVMVMDGGDCYFQVKYNPSTGQFFDLMVNGES